MCDWSVSPILAMAYTVYGIRITSMLKTFWCTKMVGHPETALGLFGPVQRQRLNRLISLSQNPAPFLLCGRHDYKEWSNLHPMCRYASSIKGNDMCVCVSMSQCDSLSLVSNNCFLMLFLSSCLEMCDSYSAMAQAFRNRLQ